MVFANDTIPWKFFINANSILAIWATPVIGKEMPCEDKVCNQYDWFANKGPCGCWPIIKWVWVLYFQLVTDTMVLLTSNNILWILWTQKNTRLY